MKQPKRIRVLKDSFGRPKVKKEMVGKDFNVDVSELISVDGLILAKDDVAELTPLTFEGKSIAIGDEVRTEHQDFQRVTDYFLAKDYWCLVFENGLAASEKIITDLRQQLPESDEEQKAKELLLSMGYRVEKK